MTFLLEPLIEVIAGFLIKQAIERGPGSYQTLRDQFKRLPPPRIPNFWAPKVNLINREAELRAIERALTEAPYSRILYLSGPGGSGKTRLLEEAQKIADRVRVTPPLRWGGILDLYHPDLRSVLHLQDAIIDKLDPEQQHFSQYKQLRSRLEQQRQKGVSSVALGRTRQALNSAFFSDYSKFAQVYRPVLAFDTLESLGHESDLIQALTQLQHPSVAVRDWLLQRINRLENTVILLAGRPQPDVYQLLKSACQSDPALFELIGLEGLNRIDTRRMLDIFVQDLPPSLQAVTEQSDQLWRLTGGLPVQLALVAELIGQNSNLQISAFKGVEIETWGSQLVSSLFKIGDSEISIFFYLALARRGLTVDLLNDLSGWDKLRCETELDQVSALSVVKTRPDSSETYLHDALYELFDAYFTDLQAVNYWYRRLEEYYQRRQNGMGNNRSEWGQATVKLLYYQLQRDPRDAFETSYLRLEDIVIRGREFELDIQLRNELLRFISSPSSTRLHTQKILTPHEIEQTSAIRWIKYFLYQSDYEQAIELAETILAFAPPVLARLVSQPAERLAEIPAETQTDIQNTFETAPPFLWGQVLTFYGEALVFTADDERLVEQILSEAVTQLKSILFEPDSPYHWLQQRMLGQVYQALGHLARTYGHFGRAIESYRQALNHFRLIDVKDEQATTLNNLAFLRALLGEWKQAARDINRAIDLRQMEGQWYPLGLSYNTRGRLYSQQGQFLEAQADCERALRIFTQIDSRRGIGLAYNALGFVFRLRGDGWKTGACDQQKAEEYLNQASRYFQMSAKIFTDQVDEPLRLWEAFNELGSVYCDWAYLEERQGKYNATVEKRKQAIKFQLDALDIATDHGLQDKAADSYDDLAQVAADQNDFKQAHYWLLQAMNIVPPEYHLDGKIKDTSHQFGDFYWLILSKGHLQQGIWPIRMVLNKQRDCNQPVSNIESSIDHFVRSAIYFKQYSRSTEALQPKLRIMARYLNRCGTPFEVSLTKIEQLAGQYGTSLTDFVEAIRADLIEGPNL